jgi:hypothetical protein
MASPTKTNQSMLFGEIRAVDCENRPQAHAVVKITVGNVSLRTR